MPVESAFRERESTMPYMVVSGSSVNNRIGMGRIGTTTFLFNRKT
ncbi:hypothetical protein MAR_027447 [Mya arenaria]|uniref:Uncharacterized protein n=2 Tax=Mya arenaria TaxID=6604 RepID=A0ABY7ETH5_MYAAR|nr:hypothetical protein MAR_027447 [Mya arenaria]